MSNGPVIKVLYVSSHYPGIGGGETYLLELAKGLGADFRVYFAEAGGNDAFAAKIAGSGYPLARLNYSLFSARQSARQLTEICRQWEIDLVHFNNRRDALLARYLQGVPKVISIHTNFFAPALGLAQNLRSLVMLAILRLTKNSIQKYITASRYSADRLVKFLNLPKEKVQDVYNGLCMPQRTDEKLPLSERRLISTVTRLYRSKGLEYLIRALALLTELPWECRIIGDGPDRTRLETLAQRHKLAHRVIFTGTLPRAQVFAALAHSRMMVLPSLYEGFPYSLLEAMAQGVPIITTRVLGLPEIIPEGKNGILVNPRDARGLAEAIRSLLTDDNRAISMGAEGRRLVATQFSLEQMMKQIRQIYKELLGEIN